MSIILNECEYAKYVIEQGEVDKKPSSTLFLLARYYKQKENLDKEQIFDRLNTFMQKNYSGYNAALWENIIEDIYKKSDRYPLKEISHIGITQSELDKIEKLPNIRYKKLVFTLLCYAKLYNTIFENNNGWVNAKIKDIYKTASVTVKHREDKFLYLNDLAHMEYISLSNKNDNLNLRITFADMTSSTILEISDFRELGLEYLYYIGDGNFIRCSRCNRLVRKKSKNDYSTKYCHDCAYKINLKKTRESMKIKYNSLKA